MTFNIDRVTLNAKNGHFSLAEDTYQFQIVMRAKGCR